MFFIKPHIEYFTQTWAPVSRHGHCIVILKLEDIQRRMTNNKTNKTKSKKISYRKRSDKLGLTTLL